MALQICRLPAASKVIVVGFGAGCNGRDAGSDSIDLEKTEDVVQAVWEMTDGHGVDVYSKCAGATESCMSLPHGAQRRQGGHGRVREEPIPSSGPSSRWLRSDLLGARATPNTADAVLAMLADGG